MINQKGVVLAIFAHPDDDALTCLGTLAKLRRAQHQVYVLTLTAGECSTEATETIRLTEAESVAQLVDYSLIAKNLPDGRLKYDINTVSLIEEHIQHLLPQVVITHFPQELGYGHQDHAVVASAVTNAARRANCVNWILYAEPPVQSAGFSPNFFVDITEYMGLKKRAITMHRSEGSKSYMRPEVSELRAKWWFLQNYPHDHNQDQFYEPFYLVKGVLHDHIFSSGNI